MHVLCAAEEREDREIVGRSAEEGGLISPHLPTRPTLDLAPKSTLDLAALQAKLKTLQARSTSPNPKPDPGPGPNLGPNPGPNPHPHPTPLPTPHPTPSLTLSATLALTRSTTRTARWPTSHPTDTRRRC